MYIFLIICHVLACLVLIGVILLQAGKGGGLSAEFGGGGGFQSIFGTKTSAFLTRATGVCAVIFLTTSLTLALVSAKRGESLVVREVAKEEKTSTQPQPAAKDTSKP
ncbi:MAG: preprotein translocase subunit SecG [Candidatus Omnitrophota bacterium]|nr:preprotein translocase subunit SecG [Candidatus Omnitrophota bacterium]